MQPVELRRPVNAVFVCELSRLTSRAVPVMNCTIFSAKASGEFLEAVVEIAASSDVVGDVDFVAIAISSVVLGLRKLTACACLVAPEVLGLRKLAACSAGMWVAPEVLGLRERVWATAEDLELRRKIRAERGDCVASVDEGDEISPPDQA